MEKEKEYEKRVAGAFGIVGDKAVYEASAISGYPE